MRFFVKAAPQELSREAAALYAVFDAISIAWANKNIIRDITHAFPNSRVTRWLKARFFRL